MLSTNSATSAKPILGGATEIRRPRFSWAELAMKYGLLAVLAVLVLVSQVLYPRFLDPLNIRNILSQNAPLGIIAVGMTLVMITRGFDLSVGSMYAAGATIFASLAVAGWSLPLAAALVILVGLVGGLINGLTITRLNVNPFVATLGTTSIFSGLALLYSNSSPFVVTDQAFTWLGRGAVLGIPVSVWLMVLVFGIGEVVLSRTTYGRSLYAIGGNDEAARLAGLRTVLIRASSYVICSGCAAVAGMIIASRLSIGQADIGSTMALDAIAVVVIGGTSLMGGEGAVWRSAIGLLIVAVLTNLLDSLAVDSNYQLVIKGTIVVAAVALDAYARTRR
ncbi:ABC transporter permease [Mesorhizobium sp. M2A.F.Ca.ET.037.01.1.1]|uniref:ABC transporter permease n=1 Tax=unclassified Mesorhizobium TaxID=325217 RepID=UPI000FC9E565|nr:MULTISPECIES: ABC transporter permease [unclassified Mesorhizobium]RUX19667.1 ABC transporter permease [Mesorhizobium sp. M2A.F.Ca.ET.037.01.1.1]RUY13186.1 ABC transporter permease [Mesorhizobium sp. M2A.F.Ca.ET.040.01.1.1]RWA91570.1 MAG: ABC transporter permease [Mesorhizobium sp.]TIV15500.1 MAG: ABC transporter permease [Mesorhizobium sp.]